jgi:hypothetical protein
MDDCAVPGLERFAKRLGGVATVAELAGIGLSPAGIRRLVRRGVLVRVEYGVYGCRDLMEQVSAREDGERLLRISALVAVAGRGAVASHHDAAVVHGLALLDRPPADVVMVSRRKAGSPGRADRPGLRIHSVAALPKDQVVVWEGVPVTSVARTVVDLARTTPFTAGLVVADSALYQWLTTEAELRSVIATCRRWPGVERARDVVDFSDRRAESPFESIARAAFRDGGLPPPELQVWVADQDGPFARVDFLWAKYRTIAEPDGALKYENPDRARRQLARDARLRRAGYEVVHFTWRELAANPEQVVSWIREAFHRSAALAAGQRRAS